ncbi:MAG: hypothetical protein GY765_07430, partial [bacterium]|nr:hypothetical protein [bacterium]
MFKKKYSKNMGPDDNLSFVVSTLLSLLHIPASPHYVSKVLTTHPDYPSLLTISEVLFEWGVETEAVKGTISDLSDIDYPVIALLRDNRYVVLEGGSGNSVSIVSPGKGTVEVPAHQFQEMWSGIIIRVVQSNGPREKNSLLHRTDEVRQKLRRVSIIPGFLILLAVAFISSLPESPKPQPLILLGILKIAGLTTCAVMFATGSDKGNLFRRICRFGKTVNCRRVLESPGGSILGISMVDMGLVYFAGGFLALFLSLFAGQTEFCLVILSGLNILALPYTFFSLFYQAFVVRTWCLLCVFVQVLFWFEFYSLYPFLSSTNGRPQWSGWLPSIFA